MHMILKIDPDYLIIDKPGGWLTIAGRDPSSPAKVLFVELQKQFDPLLICHRLDQVTSGVMVFARTADFHKTAQAWFSKHQIKKTYLFIARGTPTTPAFQVEEPIDGKSSQTLFQVTAQGNGYFYGRARPTTGRQHQIRKHLQHQGFPILGDTLYGGDALNIPHRIALHAESLTLPSVGEFRAPIPKDFEGWLKIQGLK